MYGAFQGLEPHLNIEGKKLNNQFVVGIGEVKQFAEAGNIDGLIANIAHFGVPRLRKFITIVPQRHRSAIGACIRNCERAVIQLRRLKSGNKADQLEASRLSCNLLDRNAITIYRTIKTSSHQ